MALYTKNQPVGRKIAIIVVCAILALAMTIPSVALILNRNGDSNTANSSSSTSSSSTSTNSSSSSDSTTTTQTTLLTTSQGYQGAFSDLKNAQAKSTTPEAYDPTFCENYANWVASLQSYITTNGVPNDLDMINQSYQLVVDSITDTQASSTVADEYYQYLGSAYHAWAEALIDLKSTASVDVSSQLATCLSAGIAADQKAQAYSYQTTTATDMANMYYWSGDTDDAIATAQAALSADPTLALGWYELGNYYYSSGDTEQSLDAYQNAVNNDSTGTVGVRDEAQKQIDRINAG